MNGKKANTYSCREPAEFSAIDDIPSINFECTHALVEAKDVENVIGEDVTDTEVVAEGARIAFVSDRDGDSDIYVMNADGSGVVRLTKDSAEDWLPAWSPDGGRVAFASDRDGDFEIYVMNADGSGVVQLTDNSDHDLMPAWSP